MSTSSHILDILRKAVGLWYEITGTTTRQFGSVTIDQFHSRGEAEQVAEMLKLDPTGVAAHTLLRAYFEERLKNTHISAYDIIVRRGAVEAQVQQYQALRDLLEDPDVVEIIEDFNIRLGLAVLHYGAELDETLLADKTAMAVLQRDAILAINKLRAHQFIQGEPASEPLGYNPGVYEFWNIPSLVRAMQAQRMPGISVCLIRDPDALQSFFVFAVSNGENLTVLTDKTKDSHPARASMSRRPDREYLARAGQYHFPYELVGVSVDEENKRAYAKARQGLVPYQTETVRLAEIKSLHPATVVWLTMMFDLIKDKYGKANTKLPELSYTAHLLREPESFVSANTALVQSGAYKPLVVADLTREDMTDGKLGKQWQRPPSHQNDWLIERYADQVPLDALNLLGDGDTAKMLVHESANRDLAPIRDSYRLVHNSGYRVMNPLDFGTAEDLEKDRLWTARHNQMVAIQRLANAEFERTQGDILHIQWHRSDPKTGGWYYDAVYRNKAALLEAVVRGELWATSATPKTFGRSQQDTQGRRNLVSMDMYKRCELGSMLLGDCDGDGYCCAITGARTKYIATLRPETADDVALICGCKVEDLPWQLRHWTREGEYTGNSILDRLDPKDWVLKDPWRKVKLSVRVAISQSGYNKLRKELGLPRQALPTRTDAADWIG